MGRPPKIDVRDESPICRICPLINCDPYSLLCKQEFPLRGIIIKFLEAEDKRKERRRETHRQASLRYYYKNADKMNQQCRKWQKTSPKYVAIRKRYRRKKKNEKHTSTTPES